jgi:hypothetical protein
MTSAQRRASWSAWRADGIVMASLWVLVAILLTGIAVGPGLAGRC